VYKLKIIWNHCFLMLWLTAIKYLSYLFEMPLLIIYLYKMLFNYISNCRMFVAIELWKALFQPSFTLLVHISMLFHGHYMWMVKILNYAWCGILSFKHVIHLALYPEVLESIKAKLSISTSKLAILNFIKIFYSFQQDVFSIICGIKK